jgi:hypothetical protein
VGAILPIWPAQVFIFVRWHCANKAAFYRPRMMSMLGAGIVGLGSDRTLPRVNSGMLPDASAESAARIVALVESGSCLQLRDVGWNGRDLK